MIATDKAFRMLLALWVGSMWSLLWVVMTIFYGQPDRHLAGVLAAQLFSIETYLGVAVALCAALRAPRARFTLAYGAAALLALNEWALKPVMSRALAQGSFLGLGFGGWHGVSSLLYLAACLAVSLCMWRELAR